MEKKNVGRKSTGAKVKLWAFVSEEEFEAFKAALEIERKRHPTLSQSGFVRACLFGSGGRFEKSVGA